MQASTEGCASALPRSPLLLSVHLFPLTVEAPPALGQGHLSCGASGPYSGSPRRTLAIHTRAIES